MAGGANKGNVEVLIDQLPAFPDNITSGQKGRYWIALVAPRNAILDGLSNWPRIRKMVQRLPKELRPEAIPFSHAIAINDAGEVVANLQDPRARYASITSVLETDKYLYLGSVAMRTLGRLEKKDAGL